MATSVAGEAFRALNASRQCRDGGDDEAGYASLLRQFAEARHLEEARHVHQRIEADCRARSSCLLGNLIVQTYARCGSLEDARRAFDAMDRRDLFSWGTMISAYARSGHPKDAIELFRAMESGSESDPELKPDVFAVSNALAACTASGDVQEGERIHRRICLGELPNNVVVATSLLNMYAKAGRVEEAGQVFRATAEPDLVCWNAMVAAYAQNGHPDKAMQLYYSMCLEGVRADGFTFAGALAACPSLPEGRKLHGAMDSARIELDDALVCTLVSMYARFGSIDEAVAAFDRKNKQSRNVVAWTAMVTAYSQNGRPAQAIELLGRMKKQGVVPNTVTYVSLLAACSCLADEQGLEAGASMHRELLKDVDGRSLLSVQLCNSLITMYGKCGGFESAKSVFESMDQVRRDVVTWNSMLGACAQFGEAEGLEGLRIFACMGVQGTVLPDETTFVNLLNACGKLGDLHEGKAARAQMVAYSAGSYLRLPAVKVALLNMYARCGDLYHARRTFGAYRRQMLRGLDGYETEKCLTTMVSSWNAMVASFAMYGHGGQALTAVKTMELEGVPPNSITYLSALSACARAGLVEAGREMFLSMRSDRGLVPGLEHYRSMIHLLGRAKHLKKAQELIENMEFEPGSEEWTILLGTCRAHGNKEIGKKAAEKALELNPDDKTPMVLLSNLNYVARQRSVARTQAANSEKPAGVVLNKRSRMKPVVGGRNWVINPLWFRFKNKGMKYTAVGRNWRQVVKEKRSRQLGEAMARMPKFSSYLGDEDWSGKRVN